MSDLDAWLQERAAALVRELGVPGLVAGVQLGDERAVAATGVTDVDTRVPVTRDTVFQIGSNTKLYTATAAMRLVDEQQLALDTRVCSVLPEFRLATPGAAEQVTVAHLLTHTSGIDGDITGSDDLDWGRDLLARYVEGLRDVRLVHPVGQGWSYCNSGWVLLGRVVEAVTGKAYPDALRDLVLRPLGAVRTVSRPEDIRPLRAAMGHLPLGPDGCEVVAPVYAQHPACDPAGSVMVSTADEVLDFVGMHLADGAAPGGQVLQPATARLMRRPHADLPRTRGVSQLGLGWFLGSTADGRQVVSHNGGTLGQLSVLQVLPADRLAVVTLGNSISAATVGSRLAEAAFRELAGAETGPGELPEPAAPPADLAPYAGRYVRTATTVVARAVGDALELEVTEAPPHPAVRLPTRVLAVHPVDAELFVDRGSGLAVRFGELDGSGRPHTLFNFRVLRRDDG